ncbi:MAG: ribonuclease P protein component [Holophagaceae bacterium]|uniref:Ribonuclease P protein component n=1 Tax=Candidatus Geothrix odensensis TaxID=2954440 RepID=A0A936F357_9BACT|nr:ribonuclease P protein component [Candidatus Geothrix odensensis]
MIYKGRFRTVRHKDHAVPAPLPRPLLGQASFLDIRAWRHAGTTPLLLVTSPRKAGGAVQRNRFRRQVRMAFLAGLDALPSHPWVVWVRPARMAPPLDTIRFQDIESQLRLALRRLPASDTP